jgi:hypothetical protein
MPVLDNFSELNSLFGIEFFDSHTISSACVVESPDTSFLYLRGHEKFFLALFAAAGFRDCVKMPI